MREFMKTLSSNKYLCISWPMFSQLFENTTFNQLFLFHKSKFLFILNYFEKILLRSKQHYILLITTISNALLRLRVTQKIFAIAIILFLLLYSKSGRTDKSCFSNFPNLSSQTSVVNSESLKNVFVKVLFFKFEFFSSLTLPIEP